MKKSQILREAYKLIESGAERYVCWALVEVGNNFGCQGTCDLKNEIKERFIKDGMHDESAVESWLHVVHKIPFEELTGPRLRTYRLSWLDNWATELEAKGE